MNGIRLFVGLGNPGDKYQNTRHNVGFWWVDFITENHRLSVKNNSKFYGSYAKYSKDSDYFFLKPNTFMNDSGKSVSALSNFYKIKPEEILIIHDELDLPTGNIKLKLGGGHGGHNGIKSISNLLKTNNFWRLRLGIGHPGEKNLVNNYVLNKPTKSEKLNIEKTILNSYKIFSLLTTGDFEKAILNLHSK
tara:strand:- start:3 stop:575 length:573 start_codon:yes stop_codon:yes gene_type:complete